MRHSYKFKKGPNGDRFIFTSQGTKGNIRKAVLFEMEEDGLYSLVLGDLNEKNQLKSFKLTGNGDARKVLATVADIIEFFLKGKPSAIIFITGTTKRLTNIYKKLLLKELNPALNHVKEGINLDNTTEPIDEEKEYEGFFIFRK